MRSQNLRSSMIRVAVGVTLAGVVAAGCGRDKVLAADDLHDEVVPTTPTPMPGQAHIAGVVRDGNGAGVSGATIKIAETDAQVTTDATGAYAMVVPSDSTLTLVTAATGYATSFRESVVVADMATVAGFDLTLMSTDDVARIDELGAPGMSATRGLMAVRLHSLSSTCAAPGAKVSVWPPLAATVIYSKPSTTGGFDEPDTTLASVQEGVKVDLYLAGAIPPGNMYEVTIDQPGCTVTGAPSMNGVQLTGLRHVDVQSFSEADFFLQ